MSRTPDPLNPSGQQYRRAAPACRHEPVIVLTRKLRQVSGFTLVEILIVLVIAGLLSGIALPRLQGMVRSIEVSGQRGNILDELNGLGYRAFAAGKPLTLTSEPDTNRSPVIERLMQLPDGWQIIAPQPIDYAFNGICSGGKIMLISPDNDKAVFRLAPPLCQLEPSSESIAAWN